MKKILTTMLAILALSAVPGTAAAEGKDCWYLDQHGTHDFEQTDAGYATCTEDGYYELECRQCGYNYREVTEPAHGHSFVQTELVYVNCTEDGYFVGTCTECGHKEKEITQRAHGHDWVVTHREEPGVNCYGIVIETCNYCSATRSEKLYPDGALYRGIKDSDGVKELQMMLIDLGYLNDKMDGVFGKNTEAAVKAFQKANGESADGVAWPKTMDALEQEWNQRNNYFSPDPSVITDVQESEIVYSPFCYSWENADGTMVTQQCEKHALLWETTLGMLADGYADSALYSYYEWQAEIISLYDIWSELVDGEARTQVESSKALCITLMDAQLSAMRASYDLIGSEILPTDVYYGAEMWMRSHAMWLCQMLSTIGAE